MSLVKDMSFVFCLFVFLRVLKKENEFIVLF